MLSPGTELANRYRMIRLIAQGGMSNIYLCYDMKENRQMVVKEMSAQYGDPQEQALAEKHFNQEADLLRSLRHRNLPKATDKFSQGGKFYFVMEFVEGEDLAKILASSPGPIPEEKVARWAHQIATVLYFLHCHKDPQTQKSEPIIFRDIKPSNIMLCKDTVKLIDFGIARHFNPYKKGDTMRIGSPGYAPPEQYSGQTDPRSDIYSLGVTMYHLLTKKDPSATQTPFRLPPIKTINPGVSSKMAYIIDKATQLDPANRYSTALEMKKDLETIPGVKPSRPATTSAIQAPVLTPPPIESHPAGKVPTPPQVSPPVTPQAPAPAAPKVIPQPVPAAPPKTPLPAPPAAKGKAAPASIPRKESRLFPIVILLLLACLGLAYYQQIGSFIIFLAEKMGDLASRLRLPAQRTFAFDKRYPEDLLLRRAIYNLGRGKPELAIIDLERVRQEHPENGESLLVLNNAYIEAAKAEKITIGLIVPREDIPDNHLSREIYQGSALAQSLINGLGGARGKKIYIRVLLDYGKTSQAARAARAFADDPGVSAVVGPFSSQTGGATVGIFSAAGMPQILPSAGSPSGDMDSGVFSMAPEVSEFKALSRLILEEIKPKKVFILSREPVGTEEGIANYAQHLKAAGNIEVKISNHFPSGASLETILTDLVRMNPDLIFLSGRIPGDEGVRDLETLIRLARERKISSTLLFSSGTLAPHLLKAVPSQIEGSRGVLPFVLDAEDEQGNRFFARFGMTFNGEIPGEVAAETFDCLLLIWQALDRGGESREQIERHLSALDVSKPYTGCTGTISFTKGRRTGSTWYAFHVESGRLVYDKKFYRQP